MRAQYWVRDAQGGLALSPSAWNRCNLGASLGSSDSTDAVMEQPDRKETQGARAHLQSDAISTMMVMLNDDN